jgi:IclR family pca regulon transcriptional regulator
MARIGGRTRTLVEGGDTENGDIYVQSLARGLTILTLFDIEHPEWSLHEVSRQTGISKTAAYRMLRTLEWKGFVTYHADTEVYSIGPSTIPGSYLTLSHVEFSRYTHPILEKLAAATGETVELAVEGKGGAVVVDQVATSHPFKPNLPLGRVIRNSSNSGMKLLAAFWPKAEREQLLREKRTASTPNTITDPDLLRTELEKVVATGLAFDLEEQDLGVCAVSAPVRGADGGVKAVLTVVAPAERFGPGSRKRHVKALEVAAAELSGLPGYADRPSPVSP